MVPIHCPQGWQQVGPIQAEDAWHGPTVPFIWRYCVSSALLMVLISSCLLIFILLMYSLYSFLSEAHLSWSFSCLFFLQCSVSSCFFNDGIIWQDGFWARYICIPLLPPVFHWFKCWWPKDFGLRFRAAPFRLTHSLEMLGVLHLSASVIFSWPPAGKGLSVIMWVLRQRGWNSQLN